MKKYSGKIVVPLGGGLKAVVDLDNNTTNLVINEIQKEEKSGAYSIPYEEVEIPNLTGASNLEKYLL